jgi:thiol-disulfide isomerase/thioredoxin
MKKSCSAYFAALYIFILLSVSVTTQAQQMLLGKFDRKDLETEPYAQWFTKNYENYHPQVNEIINLKKALNGKKIQVFMGTWCGDSKREVPAFMKILDSAGFSASGIEIIGVNNADSVYKQSPDGLTNNKLIFRVPTFIIYEKDKELGRITERPIQTLENDLLIIVSGKPYTPFYHGVPLVEKKLNSFPADTIALLEYANVIKPQLAGSGELNAYGYVLMAQKRLKDAIHVFQLNTYCYPADANTWDSLGEAFMKSGDTAASKNCYKRLLELDPSNKQALKMLAN